jgi:hypothetical protein
MIATQPGLTMAPHINQLRAGRKPIREARREGEARYEF